MNILNISIHHKVRSVSSQNECNHTVLCLCFGFIHFHSGFVKSQIRPIKTNIKRQIFVRKQNGVEVSVLTENK